MPDLDKDKDKEVEIFNTFIKNEKLLNKGLVYGVVYVPDEIDTDGDSAPAHVIEKAAHDFLPRAMLDIEHIKDTEAEVVESYIAPQDLKLPGSTELVKSGSWILVTRVKSNNLREMIKSGEITGYSLFGKGS